MKRKINFFILKKLLLVIFLSKLKKLNLIFEDNVNCRLFEDAKISYQKNIHFLPKCLSVFLLYKFASIASMTLKIKKESKKNLNFIRHQEFFEFQQLKFL